MWCLRRCLLKMKTKVFLSNSGIVDEQFIAFCSANDIELNAKSLIYFKPVEVDIVPEAEVVFFSSPRSVDFFLKLETGNNYVFACLGQGTAARLQSYGIRPDFVGSNSGKPDEVAKAFVSWLGNRIVLFPLSSKSNRSVSVLVPVEQLKELVVYETVNASAVIEPAAVYVFTSPSNVDAFLALNELPAGSSVIAWGRTTEKRLQQLGIAPSVVLENSSIRELERVLTK